MWPPRPRLLLRKRDDRRITERPLKQRALVVAQGRFAMRRLTVILCSDTKGDRVVFTAKEKSFWETSAQ